MQKHTHHLFLTWLIFTGFVVFLLVVAWRQAILYLLFTTDRSHISIAIVILYFFVTIHCAIRAFYISRQINLFAEIKTLLTKNNVSHLSIVGDNVVLKDQQSLPACLASDYISDILKQPHNTHLKDDNNKTINADTLSFYQSQLTSPHEIGWFCADIMIKMGLLGTIVGFILMLASVGDITEFDVATIQKILSYMSSGMGTALYTTMAGLVCSMLSATQYQILDRNANELVDAIGYLTRTHILQKLN